MARTSAKKDGSNVFWYFCEKCEANIPTKSRLKHDEICPIGIGDNVFFTYVRNDVYFATAVKKNLDINEMTNISPRQRARLVFLGENVLSLCRFAIGERVLVSLPAITDSKCNFFPIVRHVWPTHNKFGTLILTSPEDYDLYWSACDGNLIRIEKLPCDPTPAHTIVLKLNGFDASKKFITELKNFLKLQLQGLTLMKGSQVNSYFYNRQIGLILIDFKLKYDGDLECHFEHLDLGNTAYKNYCVITKDTQIQIIVSHENVNVENKHFRIQKSHIGGMDNLFEETRNIIKMALENKKVAGNLRISRGLLIYGPTGCGKTMLCEAIVNDLDTNVIRINTHELYSKYLGESESNLYKCFQRASRNFPQPTIIVIENIDNICPKEDANETVKRVSTAFLNMFDNLHMRRENSKTFVLCTTAHIENINLSLRRSGRIDTETEISVPTSKIRLEILQKELSKVQHSLSKEQIESVANVTHGFVGADLVNLVSKAAINSLKNEKCTEISLNNMEDALGNVKPSAMREILIENPNVRWADIGGLEDLKLKLKQAIEWPLVYAKKFEQLGIMPPRGVLMFGPPGCSKTMVAKALATETNVNFISIKGPELFSMWVGESEKAVREVFRKARSVAPSIIFFDEIDAIGGHRSSDNGSTVKERVLAQMLTELDGITSLSNVTIVAATNRPDMIDKALLRPGRIDRLIYVTLPDRRTREEIFKIKLKKIPLADDVLFENLVTKTEGYSGAEINAVCQEAVLTLLKDNIDGRKVEWKYFEKSLKSVQPRTSADLLKLYDIYLKRS